MRGGRGRRKGGWEDEGEERIEEREEEEREKMT